MDTQKSEILCKALKNDEIDKIPSDIAKKLEKYCESRNEDYMNTKVLHDTIQLSYGEYNRWNWKFVLLIIFFIFHTLNLKVFVHFFFKKPNLKRSTFFSVRFSVLVSTQ